MNGHFPLLSLFCTAETSASSLQEMWLEKAAGNLFSEPPLSLFFLVIHFSF